MALFRRGPKSGTIVERGRRETGRLVGIAVVKATDSDGDTIQAESYAVELSIGTVGIMQQLLPVDSVRLGMEVVAIHHEASAVIDWAATCGGEAPIYGWMVPKRVPEPGIVDEFLKLDRARRQTPATATIRAAEVRDTMMGAARSLALELTVEPRGLDAYDSELTKVKVPFYANHLIEVGNRLPVWVNPKRLDNITVDWPVAAVEDPGIGRPPSEVLAQVRKVFGGGALSSAPTQGMGVGGAPAGPADTSEFPPLEGVAFDQWIEVQVGLTHDLIAPADHDAYAQRHGVAPGTWAAADAAWNRMFRSSDWRFGMAYGEAMEAAQAVHPGSAGCERP